MQRTAQARRSTAALLAIPVFHVPRYIPQPHFTHLYKGWKWQIFRPLKIPGLSFFGGFMSRTWFNLNKKPQIIHMHRILKMVNHKTGNFNSCNVLGAESKTLHSTTTTGPGTDFEISFTYRTQLSRLTSFLTWDQGTILSRKVIIYFLRPDDGQFP